MKPSQKHRLFPSLQAKLRFKSLNYKHKPTFCKGEKPQFNNHQPFHYLKPHLPVFFHEKQKKTAQETAREITFNLMYIPRCISRKSMQGIEEVAVRRA